ncbi:MAG: PaaI family thioesterase [Bacteroidales bacterium]
MVRKIVNPFDRKLNMCFGCGPENPAGLKLHFTECNGELQAKWLPSEHYQGYPGVLHGGITAALLDETAAWFVYTVIGTAGLTYTMNVRYHHPVYINKGEVKITAKLIRRENKNALIICQLTDGSDKLCAEAELNYFLYPVNIAKQRFKYPGKEAFYSNDG